MSKMLKVSVAIATALLLALVALGCGGGDDNKDSSDGSGSAPTDFAQCLQDNGVKPPDANSQDAPSFDSAQLQKALETCREKLGEGAPMTPAAPPGGE